MDEVIKNAKIAGLGAIVVNGLHPRSNRETLQLAEKHPIISPALGIYPIEAVNGIVKDLPFPVESFDVDEEIEFIRSQAKAKKIIAIGECGLDGYWVKEDTFPEQERVFESLIEIAIEHDLPLIIHTRKRETRSMEILKHFGADKVNFHCYGGRVKNAIRWAQEEGWYFSIPANSRKNEAFAKMLAELPQQQILTETDAPYLSPQKGDINEPANVSRTIQHLAEIKGWDFEAANQLVWANFQRLFGASLGTQE